ncbi:MAG: tyrosine-type recombinase/integrase [Candidatus Acidiferrales bacterium]
MSIDATVGPRSLPASEYVSGLTAASDNAAILVRNRSTRHTVSLPRSVRALVGTTQRIKTAICLLDVPVNKPSTAFTKPVDAAVGEAIRLWEAKPPSQLPTLDDKTGELVHFLFHYRTNRFSLKYLNTTLIPALCQKAGVPREDARGLITSHRARSTIATQLFNAKQPLSLFELQAWLGHSSPHSTQHYARINPTKLARSYTDAAYFQRNIRTIEALIDQEVVRSGTADSETWHFYDLGHRYCTYDFFDQCPHRTACARCGFYRPKNSVAALFLEGKKNMLRLPQDIPLTEAEANAVVVV